MGDVFSSVFGDEAVVGEDGYGVVPVDEWDEEGGEPVGVEVVAGDLGVLDLCYG
jgi:hypothetical protein